MTKKQIAKQAREEIGQPYRWGNQWRFNWLDVSFEKPQWRESFPRDWYSMLAIRGEMIIDRIDYITNRQ